MRPLQAPRVAGLEPAGLVTATAGPFPLGYTQHCARCLLEPPIEGRLAAWAGGKERFHCACAIPGRLFPPPLPPLQTHAGCDVGAERSGGMQPRPPPSCPQ